MKVPGYDRRGAKKGVRQTHARGQLGKPKPGSPPVEERVCVIVDLMARRVWGQEGAPTEAELAAAWNVSASSVRAASAEASRRVKLLIDPSAVRERLAGALEEALRDAKGKPQQVAAVAKAYADIIGAGAPSRLEHSGPDGKPMGLQVYPIVALPALEADPMLPEASPRVASLPEGVRVELAECRHGSNDEDCGLCKLEELS